MDKATLILLKIFFFIKYLGLGSTIDLVQSVALLVFGTIFFIMGLRSINHVSKWRVEFELLDIIELYQEYFSRFKLLLQQDEENVNREEINSISNSLDTLRLEKDSLMKIKTEGNILTTITFFVITIIPPIIGLINLILAIKKQFP